MRVYHARYCLLLLGLFFGWIGRAQKLVFHDSDTPIYAATRDHDGVFAVLVVVAVLFLVFIIALGVKAQFTQTTTGKNSLIGKRGETMEVLSPSGRVRVNGEIWKAVALEGTIAAQTPIEVYKVKNFKLVVLPVSCPENELV